MKFYRAIQPIKAISFDLDDTLYDNVPIIKKAVAAHLAYLDQIPEWRQQGEHFWLTCRDAVAQANPELKHDVTQWRKVALEYGLARVGLSTQQAKYHAKQAYQVFSEHRSMISVAPSVLNLLSRLSSQYQLIAITNGNVDITKFCLKDSFKFLLMAGPDGRQKPETDMYIQAANKLDVHTSEILHVGDSLDTDVQGAKKAGCAACWLNNQSGQFSFKGLADVEISDIHQLELLLT